MSRVKPMWLTVLAGTIAMLLRIGKSGRMNQYGRQAMEHWRLHRPTAYRELTDPEAFFTRAGEEMLTQVDALTTQLAQLPMRGRVLAPLTIGHHVDHLLVRAAAERAFGSHISYYEDYPYAQQPGKLEALFAAQSEQWHSETIRLSEAAIQAKLEAILAFRSQFSTFFTDRADLERQVRGYAQLVGGERVWIRA